MKTSYGARVTSGGMPTMALAVVATAALGTGLAGCGGAVAQGAPAPTRTAQSQQEHHVAPRTPPTRDGAVQFLYAYVAERDRAFHTNDDSGLVSYSRPTCNCITVTSNELARRRAAGLVAVSGGFPHVTLIGKWERHGAQHRLGLEIMHPPTNLVDSTGKTVGQDETLIERELFTVSYESGRWLIDQTSGYSKPGPA